jgi:hypothetical protein
VVGVCPSLGSQERLNEESRKAGKAIPAFLLSSFAPCPMLSPTIPN